MKKLAAALVLGLWLTTGANAAENPVPEPDSFRTEDYRAATPSTLHGARVLATEDAERMWKSGAAAFVDVLPQAPRPPNLPIETLWRPKTRRDIPGSIWLPDTGYGQLSPIMELYFRQGLDEILAGKAGASLIFYCATECWMSWNAARLAMILGYTNVAWYPDGVEGWERAGLPVEERLPKLRPGE